MADSASQSALPFRKIFHPTDFSADSVVAFAHALKLALLARADTLGNQQLAFQVGNADVKEEMPKFTVPQRAGWTSGRVIGKGHPVKWILAAGAEYDLDLIVMVTEGHNSLFDMLLGSVTERVVRNARCPVLAISA